MMACLFRSGATYTLGNQRSFDAWGVIRQGASTGDPKGRYCAALGHKQDDESGLVYMRARYYEPASGRFISEDTARSGINFFVYAANDPVGNVDGNGKGSITWLLFCAGLIAFVASFLISNQIVFQVVSAALLIGALVDAIQSGAETATLKGIVSYYTCQRIGELNVIYNSLPAQAAEDSLAGPAVDAIAEEEGEIEGEFVAEDIDAWEDDGGATN
jgi:RHS repeat-associated protein